VLLGREAEAVVQRAPHASRRALRLQPPNGLAVVHQLVERHRAAREEPPPGRPGLTPVVLEQLGGQPARRPSALAREQRLAQLLALGVGLLFVFVGRPRVRTLGPRRALRPVIHQPVAEHQRGAAVFLVVGRDLGEPRGGAGVHPFLVGQHGAGAARELGLAAKLR